MSLGVEKQKPFKETLGLRADLQRLALLGALDFSGSLGVKRREFKRVVVVSSFPRLLLNIRLFRVGMMAGIVQFMLARANIRIVRGFVWVGCWWVFNKCESVFSILCQNIPLTEARYSTYFFFYFRDRSKVKLSTANGFYLGRQSQNFYSATYAIIAKIRSFNVMMPQKSETFVWKMLVSWFELLNYVTPNMNFSWRRALI